MKFSELVQQFSAITCIKPNEYYFITNGEEISFDDNRTLEDLKIDKLTHIFVVNKP